MSIRKPTLLAGSGNNLRLRRSLAFEPLAERVVLSASGPARLAGDLGLQRPVEVHEPFEARVSRDSNFDTWGRTATRDTFGRPGDGQYGHAGSQPPRARFGNESISGSPSGTDGFRNNATPQPAPDVGYVTTLATHVPVVIVLVVDVPSVSPIETLVGQSQSAGETMHSSGDAVEMVSQRIVSQRELPNSMRGEVSSSDAPVRPAFIELASLSTSAQVSDRVVNDAGSLVWTQTTPVDAYAGVETAQSPAIATAPEYEIPLEPQSDGGLIELETPRSHSPSVLSETDRDGAWQSTPSPGFDFAEALDWLWSEWEEFAEVLSAEATATKTSADDAPADRAAEVAQAGQDHALENDSEGGMIELAAGESNSDEPHRAYANHDGQPVVESEVRIEAGVALVRVLDVATDGDGQAPADPVPAELPPADESTAEKPAEESHRTQALTGAGLLVALPLARRRRKVGNDATKQQRA